MSWTRTRLKYLAAMPITNGLGEAGTDGHADWPRYVRTTDIASPRTLRRDVRASLSPEIASTAMLARGDILICAAGSLGVTHLFRGDEPACYAGYLARFRPRDDVDPRFIAYWLESQPFRDQLALGAVRSTIDNFSAGKIRNLELAVPSQLEQSALADLLDAETARIDALSADAGRMKLLIAERLDREISRIAVDQSVASQRLRHAVDGIEVGVVVQPAALYAPSGIPFLRGVNVKPGTLVLDDLRYLDPAKESVAAKSRLRTGDVVVVRTGQAGAAVAVPPELDGANCVDLLIVRPGRRVVSEYLELLLNSEFVRSQVATLTVGSIQSHFNVGALRETLIPVPGVVDQREIVARANEVRGRHERLLHAIDHQIALLRERRQALVTAAVSGRVDVGG